MYPVFKKSTGEFVAELTCSETMLQLNRAALVNDEDCLEYEVQINKATQYYDLINTIRLRPEMTATPNKLTITADGTDTFILTGLPIPCTVTVDDATYEVNDGEFGFPTTLPGTYIVKAIAFPYVEKTWEVIAV